jgi:hypothetical protein
VVEITANIMSAELSYKAIDAMTAENSGIDSSKIDDKRLMRLFDESGRIISNFTDNLNPLREADIARLQQLKRVYTDLFSKGSISTKFKDYCELEVDEINDVLEKITQG